MEEGKGAICVTGGTGYIASWLIKKLLEEGYSVHTTIRVDPGNRDEYSLLLNVEMVHVDDLSRAFIFLLEHPEAKGRYNCSSDRVTIQKIVEILSANYPEFTLPTAELRGPSASGYV
ncbi:hypothetical protein SCA6_015298 [Theobroma cacao]